MQAFNKKTKSTVKNCAIRGGEACQPYYIMDISPVYFAGAAREKCMFLNTKYQTTRTGGGGIQVKPYQRENEKSNISTDRKSSDERAES